MSQHNQLINKAKSIGIHVRDISELMQKDAAIFQYNSISELIIDGAPTSWTTFMGRTICQNKQLTKLVFEQFNIPYSKSILFRSPDDPQLVKFFKQGITYVCKPINAFHGTSVRMNITNLEEVYTYFTENQLAYDSFILEEQIEGEDLRIHVIKGKIIAACIRKPAYVIGNGRDSLNLLIENRRAVMKGQNPINKLEIDSITKKILREQEISLSDIPEQGRKIQLKYVSNMAKGGIAIDITDSIHPLYQDWVKVVREYLRLDDFGFDFISTNHSKNPNKHTKALEINTRANWMHHTFSEGRTHDMPAIILNALFNLAL